jgi:hypothetical protein
VSDRISLASRTQGGALRGRGVDGIAPNSSAGTPLADPGYFRQGPDGSFVGCGTGQLIAPHVVLVAAHEFPVLAGLGATRFFLSFEPTVDPMTSELL